jgi:hypothetical protein
MILNKVRDGALCRKCSDRGRRRFLPAVVYLITNGDAHKVGVASSQRRLNEHIRAGWRVHDKIELAAGSLAYRTERLVLRRLRGELGLLPYYGPGEMIQGGWSETVDAKEITLKALWLVVGEAVQTAVLPRRTAPTPA